MNRTVGLISTNYAVAGLEELTVKRPPCAVPFGGRYRLMDFPLTNMVNARITTVGLITPYYYRSILDHIGAGKEWGLDRKSGGLFVLPGAVYGFREERGRFPMRDFLNNLPFLQKNDGDYLLCSDCSLVANIDYQPMIDQHELSGRPVTLLCRRVDSRCRRKGIYLERDAKGRVTGMDFCDRGQLLFLNAFIIDRSFLLRFLRDFGRLEHMDLLHVLKGNLSDIYAETYEFEGYTGFVDGLEDYVHTSLDLLNPAVRHEVFASRVLTKVHDEPPAIYAPGSRVRNSSVAAGSTLEGAVDNSILFREVHVSRGADVRNCVLMEGCEIGKGAKMSWCVLDKNVTVGPGVVITGTEERPVVIPKGKML